jgi:hypothetical protein
VHFGGCGSGEEALENDSKWARLEYTQLEVQTPATTLLEEALGFLGSWLSRELLLKYVWRNLFIGDIPAH